MYASQCGDIVCVCLGLWLSSAAGRHGKLSRLSEGCGRNCLMFENRQIYFWIGMEHWGEMCWKSSGYWLNMLILILNLLYTHSRHTRAQTRKRSKSYVCLYIRGCVFMCARVSVCDPVCVCVTYIYLLSVCLYACSHFIFTEFSLKTREYYL